MVDAVTPGALRRLSFPRWNTHSYNLTASSGAAQAGATPIQSMISRFTTVAGAGYSGLLPPAKGGTILIVINAGANNLAVFPTGTDAIDSLGASASDTLGPGEQVQYTCPSEGQWYSDSPPTSIFQNLVVNGYLAQSVAATVSAAGSNQAGATALAAQINDVTTVGASTGVVLPTAIAGMRIEVYSNGANALKVYPPGANTIDGGSASAAVTLTSTHRCAYTAISAGSAANWLSTLLGAVSS